MSSNDQATRCVLLAPVENGAGVCEQLRARGWIAHLTGDPLPALAELCLLDQLTASRRAWGHGAQETLALVVVEPSRWGQLSAMLAAASRYVPSARLWSYDNGTLVPLPADGVSDNGPNAGREADTPNAAAPPSYQRVSPSEAASPDEDDVTPPISADEIAMLLDPDFGDPGSPSPDTPEETDPQT